MKKISKIGLLCLLCMFCILMIPKTAYAYTNTYRGIDYGGSVEEVEEFEALLRQEGYVCVSEGYSDSQEWTDTLYADEGYPYWYYIPQEDYRVYVYPLDYENYLKGETISICMNTYICNYYIFNHSNEEGNCTGKTGSAIPEYMSSGYLTIKLNVPDEFKEEYPNAIYTIILYGEETNCYYDLSASMVGQNDYYIRRKVPADKFYIYSAYVSYEYPSEYKELENGFKVMPDMDNQIEITFVKSDSIKPQEETIEYEQGSIMDFDDSVFTGIKEYFQSGSEEREEVAEKQKSLLPILLFLAGVFLSSGVMFILWLKKKRNESEWEDDE